MGLIHQMTDILKGTFNRFMIHNFQSLTDHDSIKSFTVSNYSALVILDTDAVAAPFINFIFYKQTKAFNRH